MVRNKGFAPLILLIVLAVISAAGYFIYQSIQTKRRSTETETPTQQFCGGIQGIVCSEGYSCKYDGDYPDAGGTCIKLNELVFSESDLSQGWYWGSSNQKKTGTPNGWVFSGNGSRSDCWHSPDVSCSFTPPIPPVISRSTTEIEHIEEIKTLLEKENWVSVIIGLKGNEFTDRDFRDDAKKALEIQKVQNAVISKLTKDDFELMSQFKTIPYFAGRISKSGLEKLLKNPEVTGMSINGSNTPF